MSISAIKILKNGGVGILLTDTLYGLVGSALDKKVIKRIYQIKGRNHKKPLIILISSLNDLKLFGVKIDREMKKILEDFWPGPVSIIFPCPHKKFEYLHRKTKTLAFRFPIKKSIIKILNKTGPLVAPSANPEGLPPAKNISVAKNYFHNNVDFYLNGGKPKDRPSNIVRINRGAIEYIRRTPLTK